MSVVRTTISLPEDLFAEVKKEAKKRGMSVSRFIVTSLREFLIIQRKKKLADELLEMIETNPLSAEAVKTTLEEVKKLKEEWK